MEHEFRYRLFMAYLDLDELPEVLDRVPLWSARRPGAGLVPAPSDYLGRSTTTGRRPGCSPSVRTFGHLFNPVCLYYCFDRRGEQVEQVLAEVTNTPWGERHVYVLRRPRRRGRQGASTSRRSSAWTPSTACG